MLYLHLAVNQLQGKENASKNLKYDTLAYKFRKTLQFLNLFFLIVVMRNYYFQY